LWNRYGIKSNCGRTKLKNREIYQNVSIPVIRGRDRKKIAIIGTNDFASFLLDEFRKQNIFVSCFVSGESSTFHNVPVYSYEEFEKISDDYMVVLGYYDYDNLELDADKYNINYIVWEELKNLYRDAPQYPCHKSCLFTDSFGDVYPCCKPYDFIRIGNVKDEDIYSKIVNYGVENGCSCSIANLVPMSEREISDGIEKIAIELSGECNANCTYCYERTLATYKKPYHYYNELQEMILNLKPRKIIIFGGEFFFQENSMNLIRNVKTVLKDLVVDVPTNGMVPKEKYTYFDEYINLVEVTFPAFSESNYKVLMGRNTDISMAKDFCTYVSSKREKGLLLKYLLSPISVGELADFLEWALTLNSVGILIHNMSVPLDDNDIAVNKWPGSTFDKINDGYWGPIFDRVSADVKKVILLNADEMKRRKIYFVFDPIVRDVLRIDDQYIENNDIKELFAIPTDTALNMI